MISERVDRTVNCSAVSMYCANDVPGTSLRYDVSFCARVLAYFVYRSARTTLHDSVNAYHGDHWLIVIGQRGTTNVD